MLFASLKIREAKYEPKEGGERGEKLKPKFQPRERDGASRL